MPSIVTDRVMWSVCYLVSPAKTAEAIEMPFVSTTRMGPGKHLLHIADLFEANIVLCSFNTIQPSSYSPEAILRFGRIMEILYVAKERCWRNLTHSAMTPPKVNRFGWNLEQCEPNVGGWSWQIFGAIRAVLFRNHPISTFYIAFHIFVMSRVRDFKNLVGTVVVASASPPMDGKPSRKGA